MAELLEWVNQGRESKHLHPLLIIAIFVVVFLETHPFQDGNGRLSRVLITLLLIKAGYAYVSYSSLESVIEMNKSMPTHADHTVWQDVYRTNTGAGEAYLKLTVIDDVLIVSFKEL